MKSLLCSVILALVAISTFSLNAVAPFDDFTPNTQFVLDGYANGTFPDNITNSDDTYILLQSSNQSYESSPGSNYWFWNATVYYNWTSVNVTGDRWHLSLECRFVGPNSPYTYMNGYPLFIYVLTPPSTWNTRLFCPPGIESATEDTFAACFCYPPLYGTEGYNLTTEELNGGSISMFVLGQWLDNPSIPGDSDDYTWWLDYIVIRRVYTPAPPPTESPIPDSILAIILLVLWISFAAIGVAKPSGVFLILAGFCGIVLTLVYVVPTNIFPGIAVLGAALVCVVIGAFIVLEEGS